MTRSPSRCLTTKLDGALRTCSRLSAPTAEITSSNLPSLLWSQIAAVIVEHFLFLHQCGCFIRQDAAPRYQPLFDGPVVQHPAKAKHTSTSNLQVPHLYLSRHFVASIDESRRTPSHRVRVIHPPDESSAIDRRLPDHYNRLLPAFESNHTLLGARFCILTRFRIYQPSNSNYVANASYHWLLCTCRQCARRRFIPNTGLDFPCRRYNPVGVANLPLNVLSKIPCRYTRSRLE